jgi:hypothetical protein
MAQRFKNTNRNTPLLLPVDLRDWVAEDDLVHFVIHAVQRLPLSAFAVNSKGCVAVAAGGPRGRHISKPKRCTLVGTARL